MRKKLVVIAIGLIFALGVVGFALAQEKAKPAAPAKPAEPAAKPAEPGKPPEAKPEAPKPEAAKPEAAKPEVKKEAPKPVEYRLGGIVTAVDAKARKITIDQHQVKVERKKTLTVSQKQAQMLSGINVGDAVNVWAVDGRVTKIVKVF